MSFTNFNDIARSKNQIIKFVHVATGNSVSFPGMMTQFSDDYQVSWGEEKIFGRNDPVKPYQSTDRSISITFDVLSPDFASAKKNLHDFSKLAKMLYPVYSEPLSGAGGALGRTIKSPPLMRLKFVNLIQSANGTGMLLGCVEGISYSPSQEPGFFCDETGEIYPKHFSIDFKFSPQHEDPLGWDVVTNQFLTETFPYSTSEAAADRTESKTGSSASLENAGNNRALD